MLSPWSDSQIPHRIYALGEINTVPIICAVAYPGRILLIIDFCFCFTITILASSVLGPSASTLLDMDGQRRTPESLLFSFALLLSLFGCPTLPSGYVAYSHVLAVRAVHEARDSLSLLIDVDAPIPARGSCDPGSDVTLAFHAVHFTRAFNSVHLVFATLKS